MTHLYRIGNTSSSRWVAHFSAEQAMDFFFQAGFAKTRENIRVIGDQTDFYLNQKSGNSLRNLLEKDTIGFGHMKISNNSSEWVFTMPNSR